MIFTLASDGSSDAVLVPIITRCFRQCGQTAVVAQHADRGRIPRSDSLAVWLRAALDLYPCDALFVHRDAEAQPPEHRRAEIDEALRDLDVHHIPVVPVRMTEAWLVPHEKAIRAAAGNPNGSEPLPIPALRRLEALPDPKAVLHELLKTASGLNARRRARLPLHRQVHLIPNYVEDDSCLEVLPAFQSLQQDIRELTLRR